MKYFLLKNSAVHLYKEKVWWWQITFQQVGSNSMHEFLNQIQSKQAEKFANNEIDNGELYHFNG